MTAIEVFQFPTTGQQIRTILSADGVPLFCVADTCRGLQHSNPSVALKLVDEDDRVMVDLRETDSGSLNRTSIEPRMWFVTEAGFYTLALASQAPGAKAFRRWITHEVLPALRKTGRYEVAKVSRRELALMVIEESDRADRAEAKALELEPAASAWNTLGSSDGDYSVREAAFILNRDPAIQIGQNRLFNLLRQWRLIDQRDIPYASHEAHVRLRPQTRPGPEEGERLPAKPQVRVTYEGLRYLHKRMGGAQPLSLEAEEAA